MAPRKSKASAAEQKTVTVDAPPAAESAAEEIQPEVIEVVEPVHEDRRVTFAVDEIADHEHDGGGDSGDDCDEDACEDDDDDDEVEDIEYGAHELTIAVGQMTQLLMTEEGEAITDVLSGLRDAIEKQNKILYRGLQLLESRR